MSYPPPTSAAPVYGQPPHKNRGGLVIALIVVVLIVFIGAVGLLAYNLVNDHKTSSANPGPGTSTAPPQPTSSPTAAKPRTTAPRTTVPSTPIRPTTKPPTTKPPSSGALTPATMAGRFVAQLNTNNTKAAAALACESSKTLIPSLMQDELGAPTRLATRKPIGQRPTFVFPLTGTTKGAAVTGVIVIQQIAPEPLCVRVFQVSP